MKGFTLSYPKIQIFKNVYTIKKQSPSHSAFHSFSSGLNQFHYNEIIMTSCPTQWNWPMNESRGNDQWNPSGLLYCNGMYYTKDNSEQIIPCDP